MSEFRSSSATANSYLDRYVSSEVPGLQYVVVTADRIPLEYAGGLADVAGRKAMTLDTTLMAYSMTKPFTAVVILQLVERAKLSLEAVVDQYLPSSPYGGHGTSLRQLLDHTPGIRCTGFVSEGGGNVTLGLGVAGVCWLRVASSTRTFA